ncbi:helix-turn-helix domain-containing protein [Actinomycetes bacterium KLBMP 9759]
MERRSTDRSDVPDWCSTRVDPDDPCPVDATINALRGRWTIVILREFFLHGELAYSDLSARLRLLSEKVLSDRLGHLTAAGVLQRRRIAGWPPRVTYSLSERGRALGPVVQTMWDWGAADTTAEPAVRGIALR